ncbi:MAG: pyrroline-5-carboxylate reductase [Deltaproteobacteria bacterium]|nr:pyrroline-5-carboxylate reductase [Deltaproteobacteria bacterium]
MLADKNLGVIGAGNMGKALVAGLVKACIVDPGKVLVSDISADKLARFESAYGVRTTADNRALVESSDLVVLAVKPQVMGAVLADCGDAFRNDQVVISIAAGITTGYIESRIQDGIPVVRVMPNTPAMVGEAMTPYCLGRHGFAEQSLLASQIFSAVGVTVQVEESFLDAITALSGSGPAYLFYLLEGLIEAGRDMGLPDHLSRALVRQTAFGAARLVHQTTSTPGELREQVTSPQGTTHAAVTYLEEHGFSDILRAAVIKARDRAVELGRLNGGEKKEQ